MLKKIIDCEIDGLDITLFSHGPCGPFSVRYGLQVTSRIDTFHAAKREFSRCMRHALALTGLEMLDSED